MGQAIMRRGWCPGVLRPMETGDGLLARIRITGGRLSPVLASDIARWARDFGNGLIDLSARGNLQLRGVSEATLPHLSEAMAERGLLDDDPAAEQVRNVLLSPLSGLGAGEAADLFPLAQALEERLRLDKALHALPGKFGFALDDGGPLPLPLADFDIGLRAEAGGYALFLSGQAAGFAPEGEALERMVCLALLFLQYRQDERRMAGLLRRLSADALGKEAELAPVQDSAETGIPAFLGQRQFGTCTFLGAGLPFGRLSADDLDALVSSAPRELRLSPYRAILLIAPQNPVEQRGFLFDDLDPLRRIAACPGSPSCPSASRPVQEDARLFAERLGAGAQKGICLHLSGCAKGCAHPRSAALTLVAEAGHYSLVRTGQAGDVPIARGLTLDEALQECR